MKKQLIKGLSGFFVLASLMVSIFSFSLTINPKPVNAVADFWGGGSEKNTITSAGLAGDSGLSQTDPREIIAKVVKAILGFLGIIAVIIILLGGFKYMTAGGAEDKVDEAKKLMISGVIGLIIVVASFGIATFVIDALTDVVTPPVSN